MGRTRDAEGPGAAPTLFGLALAPARWRRALALGGASLTLVGVLVALGAGLSGWRRGAGLRAITARLEAEEQRLGEGGRPRPVLRGVAVEGDAVAEAAAALEDIGRLPDEVHDYDAAQLLAVARRHQPAFDRLRLATQRSFAGVPPDRDERNDNGDCFRDAHRRAVHVLQGLAVSSEAGECLRIAADMVRLGQDAAASGGLGDLADGADRIREGAETACFAGCDARASAPDLAAAAAEFRMLARNLPAAGRALARDAVRQARAVLEGGQIGGVGRWLTWNAAARATATLLDEVPSWESLGPMTTPAAFRLAQDIRASRASSAQPLVRARRDNARAPLLVRHLESQAYLRMAALVLAARVDPPAPGALPTVPPATASDEDLADPFSGRPLRWSLQPGLLLVWSVGPDGRDDGGDAASDDRWFRIKLEPNDGGVTSAPSAAGAPR